jgi:hypothetical protein
MLMARPLLPTIEASNPVTDFPGEYTMPSSSFDYLSALPPERRCARERQQHPRYQWVHLSTLWPISALHAYDCAYFDFELICASGIIPYFAMALSASSGGISDQTVAPTFPSRIRRDRRATLVLEAGAPRFYGCN